jgi:hypothetical protein
MQVNDGWYSPFEIMKRVPREFRFEYEVIDGEIVVHMMQEYLQYQNAPHADTYPGELILFSWNHEVQTGIRNIHLRGFKSSDVPMYNDDGAWIVSIAHQIVKYFSQRQAQTLVITDIIK